MEPKWSPALSTIVGIMSMGILNMLKAQPAYWWVKGSYIPVAAMLDTAHHYVTRVHNTYSLKQRLSEGSRRFHNYRDCHVYLP